MLQLILGVAGTGKSSRMLAEIQRRANAGQQSILLVPEQFSATAEGVLYRALGDERLAYAEVRSFRTLAESILKAAGGLGVPLLEDAGRVVFVRRALQSLSDSLPQLAARQNNTAYCRMCADTLEELKSAGVTPEKLAEIGAESEKFRELSLLMQRYAATIDGVAADPEDRLSLAARRADPAHFAGVALFADNFDGFTAPEFEMLALLLAACENVSVALCCDACADEDDDGLTRFSPVRRTAQQLEKLARQTGVPCAPRLQLPPPPPETGVPAGLRAVGRALCDGLPQTEKPPTDGVYLTNCADEWEEMQLVAAEMRRLALAGAAYSSMAVICRDLSAYRRPARRAFALYGIPYFDDAPDTIEYTAPVAFLRAGLGLLQQGLVSEPILALLKTELCGYDPEEMAALENYVYTWAPKAGDWRAVFDKNPEGLLARDDEAAQLRLAVAERVRGEIVPRLETFIAACKQRNARNISRQLYLLCEAFGAPQRSLALADALEGSGDVALAEGARRSWDLAMGLLDEMVRLLGEEKLTAAEYEDLFLILVRNTEFASAPQTLEAAVLTSADRMRLNGPATCFVVGLTQGDFPRQTEPGGLLNYSDRKRLEQHKVELRSSPTNSALLEEMYLYRALTAPLQRLYLSWPSRLAGQAKEVSAALEELQPITPPPLAAVPEVLAATPHAAFAQLCALYRENTPVAAGLLQAVNTAQPGLIGMLDAVDNDGRFVVSNTQVLESLVGRTLTLSATRTNTYYSCPFQYYMQQVVKVRARRKGEMSLLESGTFVHFVLQKVLEELGPALAEAQEDTLHALARRYADEFVTQNLPTVDRRTAALLERIVQSTARLLCHLRDAAAASDFTVAALELGIGHGPQDIPPLQLGTSEGRQIELLGRIDRVDVLRAEGKTYLCITDYKTGDKKFDLDDISCGLDMQMMLYLDTLCRNAGDRWPGPVPAGVLYQPADPPPQTYKEKENTDKRYRPDGLLLEDPEVLEGIDRSDDGLYSPSKRGGGKLADLERMGRIAHRVEQLLVEMAQSVYTGQFSARPLVRKDGASPCTYCDYRVACRHEDGKNEDRVADRLAPAGHPNGEGGGEA